MILIMALRKLKETVTQNIFFQENITNYNVLLDGRNFHDQPVNDLINSTMRLERLQQDKEMITQ